MKAALLMTDVESAMWAAHQILEEALGDPELSKIVERMCSDDPKTTREQIYHTAFVQGVLSTLVAVAQGRIRQSEEQESQNN
jgi:hypothetical protein